jgi:hypothetical protein
LSFQGVDGSGILLSETLYGSGSSFHSSAGQLLTLLYSFFTKSDVNTGVLQKVLSGAVKRLIYKVNSDNFGPFWEVASVGLGIQIVTKLTNFNLILGYFRKIC